MPSINLTDHMLSMLEMALDDNSFMGDWYFDRETDDVTFITTYDDLEEEEEIKHLLKRMRTGNGLSISARYRARKTGS